MRQRITFICQQLHRLVQNSRVAADRAEPFHQLVGHEGNGTLRRVRVRLDYGTEGLDVDLPDERVTVIEPVARPAVADLHETLKRAIQAPIGSAPLREQVRKGQKIAIDCRDRRAA